MPGGGGGTPPAGLLRMRTRRAGEKWGDRLMEGQEQELEDYSFSLNQQMDHLTVQRAESEWSLGG